MAAPRAQTVPQAATSSSFQTVSSGASVLRGFAVCETAGAAAAVRLRDGQNASAPMLVAKTSLVAGESVREWFGGDGLAVSSGSIYVEVVSGTVEVTVWWA